MYMYIYSFRHIADPTAFTQQHLTLDLLTRTLLWPTLHVVKLFNDLILRGSIHNT